MTERAAARSHRSSVGFGVQVALLAGQNAVERRNLGVATGALNFFKSIGGALGAALFGAILAAALPAAQSSAAQSSAAPAPAAPAAAAAAQVPAFAAVFRWTVPFMALALVLTLVMREKPLSEEMIEVVEGRAEVPEY